MIVTDNEGNDFYDSVEDHKNDQVYCHDRQGNRKWRVLLKLIG